MLFGTLKKNSTLPQCTYAFRWCSLTDLPQVLGVHARQAAIITGSLRFPGSPSMFFILNHSQERTSLREMYIEGKCLKALS